MNTYRYIQIKELPGFIGDFSIEIFAFNDNDKLRVLFVIVEIIILDKYLNSTSYDTRMHISHMIERVKICL